MPLGIFIDKELQKINNVFVPLLSSEDSFLIDYAQKLIYNNNSKIIILDVKGHFNTNFVIKSAISSLVNKFPENIGFIEESFINKDFLPKQDLMLVSLESWKNLVNTPTSWLSGVPSVLILKP